MTEFDAYTHTGRGLLRRCLGAAAPPGDAVYPVIPAPRFLCDLQLTWMRIKSESCQPVGHFYSRRPGQSERTVHCITDFLSCPMAGGARPGMC